MHHLILFLAALTCLSAIASTAEADETAEPYTILFLGDSLTEGYGIPKTDAFPALVGRKLEQHLQRDIDVINGGVSGSTTAGGLQRLQWYLKRNPDLLVLALGANDGLRGLELAASKRNLLEIIDTAQAQGVTVVLAGMMMPPNYGPDYTAAFARMYKEIAAERDLGLIPFLLQGVARVEKYNLPDGIHPNQAGHQVIADTVFQTIKDLP